MIYNCLNKNKLLKGACFESLKERFLKLQRTRSAEQQATNWGIAFSHLNEASTFRPYDPVYMRKLTYFIPSYSTLYKHIHFVQIYSMEEEEEEEQV